MSLSGKKSSSKQESGMNVYAQLASRALLASLFGQDQFENLGIGSYEVPGGGSIPDSEYGDLGGIAFSQSQNLDRIAQMRNALAGGYNDYMAGDYDAGFRDILPPSPMPMAPPNMAPSTAPPDPGKVPKKPAKGAKM